MSADWKQGLLYIDEGGCIFFAIDEETAARRVIDVEGGDWYFHTLESPRPLAVIDPEDREQVERLAQAFYSAEAMAPIGTGVTPSMQAALREFASPKPPKPDEPMGWLAVVEDSTGFGWYRWSVRPRDRHQAWISSGDDDRCHPTNYADIDAVRILSEGVPS